MAETKVVHCKAGNFDVYIGRKASGMHFGNPFGFGNKSKMTKVDFGTREECIEAFRKWILGQDYQDVEPDRRKWILDNIERLRGKRIACYCSPRPCHGDVYVEMLNGQKIQS